MSMAELCAAVLLGSLIVYALMGGADYGGGVWDLLARGPRAERQRQVIADAIGPIWEANHVWLILAVVVLFTAFPPAFALIMTALHIPVALMLVGIVLRGSSFVFRKYDTRRDTAQQRWGLVFSISSLATPVLLGVVAGAISMPGIVVRDGVLTSGFFHPWLRPFPWAVGALALVQFAFLAATYLTLESDEIALQEDFRRRGLGAALALGAVAAVVLALARFEAPAIWQELTRSGWALVLHLATGLAALGAIAALWLRRYRTAAGLAALQVALILVGWGLALHPYLVADALTLEAAAAPAITLRLLLLALAAGSVILLPAFGYLYLTFKRRNLFG